MVGRGYKIVSRNFRTRFGEIDIVAWDKDELVFIEVKARTATSFGTPAEAVTKQKLTKLQLAIGEFMVRANLNCPVRLEVAEVDKWHKVNLIQDIEPVDNQTFSG